MLVYDLESDGLLDELTRIHCLNILDTETGEYCRFNRGHYDDGTPCHRDGSIEQGLEILRTAPVIGGHNVIPFDNEAIAKCYPGWKPEGKVRDSLAECRVIWTNLYEVDSKAIKAGKRPQKFIEKRYTGSHSLGAWGFRMGVLKEEYDGEWGAFTPDMDRYADGDCPVTQALFDLIDSKEFSREALDLETEVYSIIRLQEKHGFLFDVPSANRLLSDLQVRHAELEDLLRQTFKPWWAPKRKGGRHEVIVPKRDNRAQGYVQGCPATKVELVVFNPASRDHIADRLTTLFGWQPVEFTPTGKPAVDETTLTGMTEPEAKLLVEYLTVDKRLGQLHSGKNAWLSSVKADGRIHGRVNSNGAVTGRMTHSNPNVAQVPRVGSLYGAECRSLFISAPGYKLVGCDAEGLELRMLAHYMARFDGGAYGDTVVNGKKSDGSDVHTVNQRLLGLRDRDNTKTWTYAYLYGAGNLKLGSIVYDDFSEAQRDAFNAKHPPGQAREKAIAGLGLRARTRLEGGLTALGKLQDLVKDKARRGFVLSLDGRKLHVRSAHACLNTLLQGAGAVVMKKALVLHYRACLARGWVHGVDWGYAANVHDEAQMEAREEIADEIGRMFADAIAEAGRAFDLKCPLSGAFAVGRTWKDTH